MTSSYLSVSATAPVSFIHLCRSQVFGLVFLIDSEAGLNATSIAVDDDTTPTSREDGGEGEAKLDHRSR